MDLSHNESYPEIETKTQRTKNELFSTLGWKIGFQSWRKHHLRACLHPARTPSAPCRLHSNARPWNFERVRFRASFSSTNFSSDGFLSSSSWWKLGNKKEDQKRMLHIPHYITIILSGSSFCLTIQVSAMTGNRLRRALGRVQAFTLPSPPSPFGPCAKDPPKSVRIGFPGASLGWRGARGSIIGDRRSQGKLWHVKSPLSQRWCHKMQSPPQISLPRVPGGLKRLGRLQLWSNSKAWSLWNSYELPMKFH